MKNAEKSCVGNDMENVNYSYFLTMTLPLP